MNNDINILKNYKNILYYVKKRLGITIISSSLLASFVSCGKVDGVEKHQITNYPTGNIIKEVTYNPTNTSTPIPTFTMTNEPTITSMSTNTITPEPTITSMSTNTVTPEPTYTPIPNITEEVIITPSINYSDNESEVMQDFKNEKIKIYDAFNKEEFEELIEMGKSFFIKAVDFIFYDSEINGITFEELKEESKQELFNELCEIDELIMKVAPNYKDNISEKYIILKDFMAKSYYYVLDKIKQAITEENYQKISEIKDSLKDNISEKYDLTSDKVKKYVKDWYEDFKEQK